MERWTFSKTFLLSIRTHKNRKETLNSRNAIIKETEAILHCSTSQEEKNVSNPRKKKDMWVLWNTVNLPTTDPVVLWFCETWWGRVEQISDPVYSKMTLQAAKRRKLPAAPHPSGLNWGSGERRRQHCSHVAYRLMEWKKDFSVGPGVNECHT